LAFFAVMVRKSSFLAGPSLHAEREAILINEEDMVEWEENGKKRVRSHLKIRQNMILMYIYIIVYTHMSTVKVFVDIYLFVGLATPCASPLHWPSFFWINLIADETSWPQRRQLHSLRRAAGLSLHEWVQRVGNARLLGRPTFRIRHAGCTPTDVIILKLFSPKKCDFSDAIYVCYVCMAAKRRIIFSSEMGKNRRKQWS
jgi:hypothetical protein